MNYFILILIIIVCAIFLIKTKKEHFSLLACPLNPYITERTPTEYIFDTTLFNRTKMVPMKTNPREHFVGQSTTVPRQIWIYYPFEKNSRNWLDWGSRLRYQPNTKLFEQCVVNLKKKTGWTVIVLNQQNLSKYATIPKGLEENELYIQSVIMHQYGGLWLPAYSFPVKNVDELRSFVKDIIIPYIPDLNQPLPVMCVPGLQLWAQMAEYIVKNPTPQNDYSDYAQLYYLATCNHVRMVDGRVFGMLDKTGRMITFLNLVSDSCSELADDTYLVCINKIEEERLSTQYIKYNSWYNHLLQIA
jgi:hypothetical protein